MVLRTPNLAGEDRRPALEEREPEAAVHLLVKHIKGGESWRPDQGRRGRGQGVIVITAGSSGPPALRDTPFISSDTPFESDKEPKPNSRSAAWGSGEPRRPQASWREKR